MKISDLFAKWNLTGLKVKTPILDMEWKSSDPDRDAAWDLYIKCLLNQGKICRKSFDDLQQSVIKEIGVQDPRQCISIGGNFSLTRD